LAAPVAPAARLAVPGRPRPPRVHHRFAKESQGSASVLYAHGFGSSGAERARRRQQVRNCAWLEQGPGRGRLRMVNPQMVMYEEEFNQIQAVVDRLVRDANAKVVFIVDKNGQLIAASGDVDNVDTTSLASLTAGNIAATGGIAKLLKENEFATQFHEGEKANIHIQLVGNRVILVVIFDSRSSLGLVRLRVKKASEELNHIFESLLKKVATPGADSPFAEITDEDIDNLFND
jgi:predicted regulator of Ras-like GTPase activity (Roadblock/LC7/MglB family)